MAKENNAALAQNADVAELIKLLKADKDGKLLAGLLNKVNQFGKMEKRVETLTNQLSDMAEKVQAFENRKNPIARAYKATVEGLQFQVFKIGVRLTVQKEKFIAECKGAVAIIKQKGISGLNKTAGFLKVGKALKAISKSLEKVEKSVDKAVKGLGELEKAANPQQQTNVKARQPRRTDGASQGNGRAGRAAQSTVVKGRIENKKKQTAEKQRAAVKTQTQPKKKSAKKRSRG